MNAIETAPVNVPVIAPEATVGDSVLLTVEDLTAFLPTLKGKASEITAALVARYGISLPAAEKAVKGTKTKVVAAKKSVTVTLPEAGEDGAPEAASYRLDESDIDMSLCLARKFIDAIHADKRWSPSVYSESQCVRKPCDGSDLCTQCSTMLEKCLETGVFKHCKWAGRVTEEPPAWVHMLGTTWAADKSPKWKGVAGAASEDGSVSGASEQKMSVKSVKSAKSAEEKAAEKEAVKAAKTIAKEAEKEAVKAAKAAEKEAAKTAKAAEKEAAKAAKAEKPKKEVKPKAVKAKKETSPAAEVVSAKASVAAEVGESNGELKLIDGALYMVSNGNVYEYDELSEKPGDFVGRLTADETIDADAEEQGAAESDAE